MNGDQAWEVGDTQPQFFAKQKLSQNKPEMDRFGAAQGVAAAENAQMAKRESARQRHPCDHRVCIPPCMLI
mgnify:CR=1